MAGNVSGGWNDISRAFGGANDWNQSLPSSYGPYYSPENDPRNQNLGLSYRYGTPLLQQLQQAAAGQGPSQAQNMLREGTANTVASQYGAAATPSVGGAQQAALIANAQNNAGAAMQQGARQAAQLRAQEMTDARQQMAQALQGQQQVNTQAAQQELQQRLGNIQGNTAIEALNQKTGQENRGGGFGTVLSAVGSLFSDVRAKEDIQPMAPTAFAPTVGGVGAGYGAAGLTPTGNQALQLPTVASDTSTGPAFPNYYQPPQQQEDKAGGGGLGSLFSVLSDENSKERIRALEGALAESRRTADAITGTEVQYPQLGQARLNLDRSAPPTARFADLGTPQGYASASARNAPATARTDERTAAHQAMVDDDIRRRMYLANDLPMPRDLAIRGATMDALRTGPGSFASEVDARKRGAREFAPVGASFGRFGTPEGYDLLEQASGAKPLRALESPQGSREALGPVAPYEYRYKPEFAAATGNDMGPRAGVMAQDLEQSPNPALRSAVIDTPIGKAIEPKRAISANLALSAGLDKRLRNIEGALSQPTVYPNLQR